MLDLCRGCMSTEHYIGLWNDRRSFRVYGCLWIPIAAMMYYRELARLWRTTDVYGCLWVLWLLPFAYGCLWANSLFPDVRTGTSFELYGSPDDLR